LLWAKDKGVLKPKRVLKKSLRVNKCFIGTPSNSAEHKKKPLKYQRLLCIWRKR
jgi:hypothetical protein